MWQRHFTYSSQKSNFMEDSFNSTDFVMKEFFGQMEFSQNKDWKLFYDFTLLVQIHYTEHHDVAYYAKLLHIPAKQITLKFSRLGLSNPHNYIKDKVIMEAKHQLLYTNKTIKNISYDIGFNDPDYFSRFLLKNVGMRGTQYRNQRFRTTVIDHIEPFEKQTIL